MAEDSDPPPERSAALPRRVPGAAGLTPAQVRRGYLPSRAPESGAPQTPPKPRDRARSAPPRTGGSLPQRSPGTSAIQPPRVSRPAASGPDATPEADSAPEANSTEPPSPADFAASAALLLGATRPAAGEALNFNSASGQAPPPATPRTEVSPATTRHKGRALHPGRRWRLAGIVIALVLVAAVVAIVELSRHGPATTAASGSAAAGSQSIAAEAIARGDAVAWVTSQVGTNIVVACDAVMCSDLAQHGFPAGNLNVLQPTSPDPYGSVLVIATADIRSQFVSKLVGVYAPQVIASFGAGANRIDIRVIAPQGPAAFRAALSADLAARRSFSAQLLRNQNVTTSTSARAALASGQVDVRLLTTIAFVAGQQPVDIVGFGNSAPGASPGLPLRFAYLADSDTAAHLAGSAYVKALIALVRSQIPPYVPLSLGMARLPGGQEVLRIEFAAPSPTGLPKT